jgi:aryl-alcohol dehydrogenase-like predicted oxidoreductase
MLPIPGTSSVEHLEENVAAAELKLTTNELASLGEAAGDA